MSFIGRLGSQEIAVPAAQSIIVGCFAGTAKVYYGTKTADGSYFYALQTTVTGASTLGPFASGQQVKIEAPNGAEVEYVTGAAPVLTQANPTAMPQVQMAATQMLLEAASDTLTAHAGGGQGSALALTSQTNRISTVASAGDSVKLPASAPGLEITVINHGANAMQVFGAGTDTINDVATGTGVSQMPGSSVLYFCTTAGAWYTEGLAQGFSGNFSAQSFVGGLTAHAGGGQGSALALTAMVNRVTTVASGNDSVVLPATVANISIGPITVINAAAANSMNVFPATGDAINAGAANAAFAIVAGKTATFYSAGAGQWHAVLSA